MLQSLGAIDSDLEKKNRELKQTGLKLATVLSELQQKEAEATRFQQSIQNAGAFRRTSGCTIPLAAPRQALVHDHSKQLLLTGFFAAARAISPNDLAFDQALVQALSEQKVQQERVNKELAQKRDEVSKQKRALASAAEAVQKEAGKRRELLASLEDKKSKRGFAL